ncbi:PspA/IM30 family protein [Chitinophaga barathri]|uniref:Uncharacterized protein n=2 Tax=Chitinophaga barathri TaxID=1647451 RepID=A0A3N4M570_9BACT|nr:hypothetical protein [Chitinophaga barathri]RPD38065.1 hypothetical protein EG028_27005 [Chitinophaga barathri]
MPAGTCKGVMLLPVYNYELSEYTVTGVRIREPRNYVTVAATAKKPFLVIHGNVMYDFYYQSNSDTPYIEKEIYQHTVQTTLDITVRDQYPLHLSFSTSQSNSSLLRDITGMNFRYSSRDLKNSILQKAAAWDDGRLKQRGELDLMKLKLNQKWDSLYRMKAWFSTPSQVQRLIEARERELYGVKDIKVRELPQKFPLPLKGGLRDYQPKFPVKDSSVQLIAREYEARKTKIDSLEKEIAILEQRYGKALEKLGLQKESLAKVLTQKMSIRELTDRLEAMNLPDSVLPRGYKPLLALRSAGIGRTMIDYSELTAKYISIIGVQAEFNPSWYFAFGSGAVDYRFRDFVVNTGRSRQYLNIIRGGYGMRDGSNLILSYYTGKKQAYNFNTGTDPDIIVPDNRIMGVSLEGRWQLDKNNFIVGEVAKSSLPQHERLNHGVVGSMLEMKEHSNQAYSLSAGSFIPATGTRITGMYKMMGANFQSFSLYASGSSQTGWTMKVDQPFFRQQLTVSASVRKNAFTSIFESASYMSNTVFKSIQATFRRRHWPVVTVGYFPSLQLIKTGEDKFMENMFYTMVGTASHFYQYRGVSMNTMLSATKFYNRQSDSSFVYFNSTNLVMQHSVFLGRLTLNGSASLASNHDYRLYGGDGNALYKVRQWLDVGGGLKYSYQTVYNLRQLGYSANLRVEVPKVGEIMLMADQGFVPGTDRRLVPNKTGRVTYTRIF